jgi:hypothetical protein
MNTSNASNSGGFADEIPTVQQKVLISLREYKKLQRLVREGESYSRKVRNRMVALAATFLVFVVASACILFL